MIRRSEASDTCCPGLSQGSDLRLNDIANRAIHASGYHSVRALEVRVDAGVVTLRGSVGSYYLKQVAQHLVLEIPGVSQVVNLVEVR